MDPQSITLLERNLTYPSVTSIQRFLPVSVRRRLVVGVESLRKVNQTLPVNFKKVVLSFKSHNYTVQLDDLKWTFIRNEGHSGVIVKPEGVHLPARNVREQVHALIRHYVTGRECKISELHVDNFLFAQEPLTSLSWVGTLKLNLKKMSKPERMLEAFRNTNIEKMEVDINTDTIEWSQEMRNIRCDNVTINSFSDTLDEVFNELPFKMLQVNEKHHVGVDKIHNMCQKFESGKHERGSSYTVTFEGSGRRLWSMLKDRLDADMSYNNFLMVQLDVPDCEMVVERTKIGRESTFQVRVVKSRTGKCMQRREQLFYKYLLQQPFNLLSIFELFKPALALMLFFCSVIVYYLTKIQPYLRAHPEYFQIPVTLFIILVHWGQVICFVGQFPVLRLHFNHRNSIPGWVTRFFKTVFFFTLFVIYFAPVVLLPTLVMRFFFPSEEYLTKLYLEAFYRQVIIPSYTPREKDTSTN